MGSRDAYNRRDRRWTPTQRQREVLDLLAEGKSNAEIAVRLDITVDGAKWHVGELLSQTGCEDRQTLASWWREERSRARWGLLAAILSPAGLRGVALATVAVIVFAALFTGFSPSGRGDDKSVNPEAAADFEPMATVVSQPPYVEGPPPPCDMPLPPDFRIVTREELLAQGLVESGPSFEGTSDCPVYISNRPDRSIIWFSDGGIIANGSAPPGYEFTLLRGEVEVADALPPVLITIGPRILRTGPDGVFAVMMARNEGTGRFHRIAFDSTGVMYYAPESLPQGDAYDLGTGQRIESDSAVRLLDFDLSPRGSYAFTSCEDRYTACTVSYRGASLLAPAAGRLRCLEPAELSHDPQTGRPLGEYELNTGEMVLRFREAYSQTPHLRTVFRCEPVDVVAGEIISPHYEFHVSAFGEDGTPVPVIATLAGQLFVGQ